MCTISTQQGRTPRELLSSAPDSDAKSLANHLFNLIRQASAPSPSQLPHPPLHGTRLPENLVLQGGGPKGIAYVGALQELQERGQLRELRRVAGTSAGAITATLLALNYTAAEMQQLMCATDLTSFLDHPLKDQPLQTATAPGAGGGGSGGGGGSSRLLAVQRAFEACTRPIRGAVRTFSGYVRSAERLWHTAGVCKGDTFRQWLEQQLRAKTGLEHCTFGELEELRLKEPEKGFRQLHVFATDLDAKKPVRLSACARGGAFRDVIIADAVRASMSIPAVFEPHYLHVKDRSSGARLETKQFGRFIDGGVIYNFPINAFDRQRYLGTFTGDDSDRFVINQRTLGLSLYAPPAAAAMGPTRRPEEPKTVLDLLKAVGAVFYSAEKALSEEIFAEANQKRTILVRLCALYTYIPRRKFFHS